MITPPITTNAPPTNTARLGDCPRNNHAVELRAPERWEWFPADRATSLLHIEQLIFSCFR